MVGLVHQYRLDLICHYLILNLIVGLDNRSHNNAYVTLVLLHRNFHYRIQDNALLKALSVALLDNSVVVVVVVLEPVAVVHIVEELLAE
jgi:hypothetical protein